MHGVPNYSNSVLCEEIDETSFRGAFLMDCRDVLGEDLLDEAWNSKLPEAAIWYGEALLAAAAVAEAADVTPKLRPAIPSLVGLAPTAETVAIAEQLDIVRAAGRWFIFWGQRGHPIRAWF
jgi:hypothetical protein